MSTSTQPKQTFLVLGATGGCGLNFIIKSLREGHSISALARSPTKLTTMLKENKLEDSHLKNLTITQGNSKSEADITNALLLNGQVVDMIVSGIGAVPKMKGLKPTIEDPTICADTMTCLFNALKTVRESNPSGFKKPLLVSISTTGISEYGRDLPLIMVPVYHILAAVPHEDKKLMEKMIKTEGSKEDSLLNGWVIVRASFMSLGTKEVGCENLKVGVEEDGRPMPKESWGWTISRKDVGNWIYAELVQDKSGKRERYLNRCVGITA